MPSPARTLPFDPIAEARRHWDERWRSGATMAAATSIMRAQQIVLATVDEALGSLIGEIARLPEVGRFSLAGQPLSAYGLDAPVAEITIDLDSGAQAKLEIGDRTATGSGFYARAATSEDVLQIGSLIFNEIAAALYRLRGLSQHTG